jgi:hypothetical protein
MMYMNLHLGVYASTPQRFESREMGWMMGAGEEYDPTMYPEFDLRLGLGDDAPTAARAKSDWTDGRRRNGPDF